MAIVAADRYGNILLMNHAAEDLFGYSAGRAAREIRVEKLPPRHRRRHHEDAPNQAYGGVGKLATRQIVILNSTGEEIPVELTASILYEDDQEIATMGIYNDLRDKLSAEAKLKTIMVQLSHRKRWRPWGAWRPGSPTRSTTR